MLTAFMLNKFIEICINFGTRLYVTNWTVGKPGNLRFIGSAFQSKIGPYNPVQSLPESRFCTYSTKTELPQLKLKTKLDD